MYNGKNLCNGPFIISEGDTKATITDSKIENIYSKNDGPLIKAINPHKEGSSIIMVRCQFSNFTQTNDIYSPMIATINNGYFVLVECTFQKFKGIKSGLFKQENYGTIEIKGSTIIDFYSKYPEPIFYINNLNYLDNDIKLIIWDLTVKNVYQEGVLFYLNNCSAEINNSSFDNIHECYLHNNCNSDKDIPEENFESALFYQTGSTNFKITNCTFNHIYGKYGTKITRGNTKIYNSELTNSYFQNGFLYYPDTTDKTIRGTYWFEDLLFKNNTSVSGTFLHISDVKTKVNLFGSFTNVRFISNTATNFGGVIFSEAGRNVTIDSVDFKECSFEENKAERGKISYVHDNNHDVNYVMQNKNTMINLKKDINNFVTNPTHLLFDDYDNSTLVINSGDRIGQYSCTIYDDYGNKFNQSTDISDYTLDELIFYELSLEGIEKREQHSIIYGPNSGYCLNNNCKFKNIRLVGTPGNYLLKLRIVGFGHYNEFSNNEASLSIEIKECDTRKFNYQDKDGGNIKS